MRRSNEKLAKILGARLRASEAQVRECFERAEQVIVFGSMALGLEGRNSDIDVLCIGNLNYKYKTESLDFIALPSKVTNSATWIQSELGTHVARYGVWLKGKPSWDSNINVGSFAADAKGRWLTAFVKALDSAWSRLELCFRVKYAVKLRRETQRLLLLERNVPVPPTKILDRSWMSLPITPREVCYRFSQLAAGSPNLIDEVLARMREHFKAKKLRNAL